MEKLKLRESSYFRVRAFIYDLYQKTYDNGEFKMKDRMQYYGLSHSLTTCFEYKKDGNNYRWVGKPPTDEDIVTISNKLYEYGKIGNAKKKTQIPIEIDFKEQPDLRSLVNQMAILQEMFNRFK